MSTYSNDDLCDLNNRLENLVIDKYDFYFNMSIASRENVNLDAWLSNALDEHERLFLLWIANSINFISKKHFIEMIKRTVSLAEESSDDKPFVYTPCIGKNPKPTISGNYIARILRDDLKIPEQQILSHREAISILAPHNIILFDDIIGTGSQLVDSVSLIDFTQWGEQDSLLGVADKTKSSLIYCAPLAVNLGIENISKSLNGKIKLCNIYTLDDSHSISSSTSVYWPQWIKEIINISQVRNNILERLGLSTWLGFGDLGYAIAFDHGYPDFNINLLKLAHTQWHPLFTV